MTPDELADTQQHLGRMSTAELRRLYVGGPDDWPPEAWELVEKEVAKRERSQRADKLARSRGSGAGPAGNGAPTCPTCHRGRMERKKKFRLGAMGIVFGTIIGLPSLVGFVAGGVGLFVTGAFTASAADTVIAEARASMEEAGVDEDIIDKVVSFETVSEAEMQGLTRSQRSEVQANELALAVTMAGAGLGATVTGGLSLFLFVGSTLGLVLAWILTLRKKVLQCANCKTVVAAS